MVYNRRNRRSGLALEDMNVGATHDPRRNAAPVAWQVGHHAVVHDQDVGVATTGRHGRQMALEDPHRVAEVSQLA